MWLNNNYKIVLGQDISGENLRRSGCIFVFAILKDEGSSREWEKKQLQISGGELALQSGEELHVGAKWLSSAWAQLSPRQLPDDCSV